MSLEAQETVCWYAGELNDTMILIRVYLWLYVFLHAGGTTGSSTCLP